MGTDPGGLVLRVSPAGEGFVLYQMPKSEVTAVAVASDGSIYAAAAGVRGVGAQAPAPAAAAPQGVQTAPGAAPGAATPPTPRPAAPPPTSMGAAGAPGGSEIYRIDADGNPMKIWSSAQDVVYAIAFDAQGRVIVGRGNKGNLYRMDSPTTLHVTAEHCRRPRSRRCSTGSNGQLYAATGNVGKVYEIGPGVEHEGTIESDVFDSSLFHPLGPAEFRGQD